MIYDGEEGDITVCHIYKSVHEQMAFHGRSQKAVLEKIHICKDRNVLREYLSIKEKDVVDILASMELA